MNDRWVVDSPAIGTGLRQRPCGDTLRPAEPPLSENSVAVTMSGGGFRATLPAVGVVRLLADAGMLSDVHYVSSVSGGSIANGVLAVQWPELRRQGFTTESVDRLIIEPLVDKLSARSLKLSLVRGAWRTIGPTTRTELLARRLDEWFFSGRQLAELDPSVRWIVNAANQTTGVRFTFERDVLGDYTIGLVPTPTTNVTLSLAIAASAAVPGAFPPLVLQEFDFPCGRHRPALLDGGTYDNLGLEALDGDRYRQTFLVCLNAGGLLQTGPYGKLPIVRDLSRANSLLYRQSTALRTRAMVDKFDLGRAAAPGPVPRGARRGILFALASDFPAAEAGRLADWRARFREHRTYKDKDLALVPTVFDKLDPELCRALVYRGWWLAGAALATYHPERLPDFRKIESPSI